MSDPKTKRPVREAARQPTPPAAARAETVAPSAPPEAGAEAAPASAQPVPPPPPMPADSAPDAWTVLADAQAALARGFEALAFETTAFSRAGTTAATDAGLALLGARTLAEAIEINATLARRELDALIEGGAKLSEIGIATWSDAARPILSRLGAAWGTAAG